MNTRKWRRNSICPSTADTRTSARQPGVTDTKKNNNSWRKSLNLTGRNQSRQGFLWRPRHACANTSTRTCLAHIHAHTCPCKNDKWSDYPKKKRNRPGPWPGRLPGRIEGETPNPARSPQDRTGEETEIQRVASGKIFGPLSDPVGGNRGLQPTKESTTMGSVAPSKCRRFVDWDVAEWCAAPRLGLNSWFWHALWFLSLLGCIRIEYGHHGKYAGEASRVLSMSLRYDGTRITLPIGSMILISLVGSISSEMHSVIEYRHLRGYIDEASRLLGMPSLLDGTRMTLQLGFWILTIVVGSVSSGMHSVIKYRHHGEYGGEAGSSILAAGLTNFIGNEWRPSMLPTRIATVLWKDVYEIGCDHELQAFSAYSPRSNFVWINYSYHCYILILDCFSSPQRSARYFECEVETARRLWVLPSSSVMRRHFHSILMYKTVEAPMLPLQVTNLSGVAELSSVRLRGLNRWSTVIIIARRYTVPPLASACSWPYDSPGGMHLDCSYPQDPQGEMYFWLSLNFTFASRASFFVVRSHTIRKKRDAFRLSLNTRLTHSPLVCGRK